MRKPLTPHCFQEMHATGNKIAMLDVAGIDCLQIGGSLGMVLQGQTSTSPFGCYEESKEQALHSATGSALDDGVQFTIQGNLMTNAAALLDATIKHNERESVKRDLFLNYSDMAPILNNLKCRSWYFRFDEHAGTRMAPLMELVKHGKVIKRADLIGQDYSFGQAVLREVRRQQTLQRPAVVIAEDELHPVSRIKDFLPYAKRIKQRRSSPATGVTICIAF